MSAHISDRVYALCKSETSVSSEYVKDSTKTPGHFAEKLYAHENPALTGPQPHHERDAPSQDDLDRAWQCGKWGDARPSDLFLACYHDALCSLEHDPLAGAVSPSLMGSNGVIPLSIISTLPDICRHMANLIVRAEHEVFLATNFWAASEASRIITDALVELSRRAGARGRRVVVKIMYDRGNIKQVVDNHQIVPVKEYIGKAVKLPAPEDIPHVDLQVQNYHRPALGTFHAKFMVVDRRFGITQSNNIQDNDNLEMMTQFEGPIVDSLYDTALIAWYTRMDPPMPLLWNVNPATITAHTFQQSEFQALFKQKMHDSLTDIALEVENTSEDLAEDVGGDPHYDNDVVSEIRRQQHALKPRSGESVMDAVTRHLNKPTKNSHPGTAPACEPADAIVPITPHHPHVPFPIALVNRRSWGAPNHQSLSLPQNEAWLSAIRYAKSSVFIQTPNLNASPLISAIELAVKRGVEVTYFVCLGYNDAGELLPFQGGTNEMVANKLYSSLDFDSRKRLHVHYYVGKDQVMPIHNKFKVRSCHVKLMIVDGHLGIQGSGNQDTQSWFHSMEVNIMIDSEQICSDWMSFIRRNQNTHVYGKASQEDGIWRDAAGKEPKGAVGKDPGRFAWAKGIIGAVQRVRGAGDF